MTFYNLKFDHDGPYLAVEYSEDTKWGTIYCPRFPGHQRIGERNNDIHFEINDEEIERDFYWTFASELVVTAKVVSIFEHAKLTGFTTKPATLIKSNSSKEFREFISTGVGGLADNMKLHYKCDYCGLLRYAEVGQSDDQSYLTLNKIDVNSSKWDRSDFFTVTGVSRMVLVSEKAKDIIVNQSLKGVKIVRAEDFESTVYSA